MRVCGAKMLAYVSKEYGDVVLIRWGGGRCTILREMVSAEGKVEVYPTHISAEAMGKLDELRGKEPDDTLSLATAQQPFGGTATWVHPEGGTIKTTTITTTCAADTPAVPKRSTRAKGRSKSTKGRLAPKKKG